LRQWQFIVSRNPPRTRSIGGTDPRVVFTNVDNIIAGAGQLGEGQMTLVNGGTIDASGINALVLDTESNVISNSGTPEATGAVSNNGQPAGGWRQPHLQGSDWKRVCDRCRCVHPEFAAASAAILRPAPPLPSKLMILRNYWQRPGLDDDNLYQPSGPFPGLRGK
jgi:hypothetical protein